MYYQLKQLYNSPMVFHLSQKQDLFYKKMTAAVPQSVPACENSL